VFRQSAAGWARAEDRGHHRDPLGDRICALPALDSAISWTATLHPFAAELPAGTDWIHFGGGSRARAERQRVAQEWTWADQHNTYLD
jgi:hypothetical protein